MGAPVAQWVKCCMLIRQTELDPSWKRDLLNRKQSSIAYSLSLSSKHHPDMTEILLKRT